MPLTPAQTRLIRHQHRNKNLPSLHQHAVFNSFFARELKNANRRTYILKQRIKDLERERDQYVEQMVLARQRADNVLMLGHEEDTIKYEIKQLKKQREELELEIIRLRDVVHRLKTNLREGFKRN